MDTKQLVTFVTFAKEKSFTKSSMKLNYAVSTLSEHISSLEAELGTQLVERHGKRTALTQNGEIFLEYAHKLCRSGRKHRTPWHFKIPCMARCGYWLRNPWVFTGRPLSLRNSRKHSQMLSFPFPFPTQIHFLKN